MQLSSYRLGDLVLLSLSDTEKQELIEENPNSLGSKYLLDTGVPYNNNIERITKLVLENIESCVHLLPNDISESTVIHLRLGDVISGKQEHEALKRPFSVEYIKSIVTNTDKIYVIGKCFFAKTSSTNYEECITSSNLYLQNVLNALNATHFDSGNADIDLYCAVKAKVFVQGKGYFSKLIVEIRKELNLANVETSVLST